MQSHRRDFARRARASFVWGIGLWITIEVGLHLLADFAYPEIRDPEYGYRLAQLRQRMQLGPKRPLVVSLGSSLVAMGFRPDIMPACSTANGQPPLVFNFAILGAGPLGELVTLRHLLADGIHPDWLVIEVMPPLLHQEQPRLEENWFHYEHTRWADALILGRHFFQPATQYSRWLSSELVLAHAHRFAIMTRFALEWLPRSTRQDCWRFAPSLFGWLPWNGPMDAAEYRRRLESTRKEYEPAFDNFHVTDYADRPLREILDLCRCRQLKVLLLVMPEGSEFRSWYPAHARAEINRYLAGLCHEWGVSCVDASTWMGDACFFDSHHLHYLGATHFSLRFGQEILPTLFEKNDDAAHPKEAATPAVEALPVGAASLE